MAITVTDGTLPPFSIGDGLKAKLMTYRALTGATSGTVTATGLKDVFAILLDGQIKHSAAETFSGNVATLAFAVPAETAAARTIANITYTAAANWGQDANAYSITLIDGSGDQVPVTDGNELCTVSGGDVSVRIDPTAVTGSTKQHVVDKINATAAAAALFTAAVAGGHESDVCPVASKTTLTGGVTGGARGSLVCLGR